MHYVSDSYLVGAYDISPTYAGFNPSPHGPDGKTFAKQHYSTST